MEDLTEEQANHVNSLIRQRDAAWAAGNWDAFEFFERKLEEFDND
jgi:hypothetical protein